MKTENSTVTSLTLEEIKAIPLGFTYDFSYRTLSYRNSTGQWEKYTRDSLGNVVVYQDSSGYWRKHTRDSFGNYLSNENSYGKWFKYTRDLNGEPLTFEDSYGNFKVFLGKSDTQELWYCVRNSLYESSYFSGSYQEAMKYWNIPERTDDLALYFTLCIQIHHESLSGT
jgi:hypothetical protein